MIRASFYYRNVDDHAEKGQPRRQVTDAGPARPRLPGGDGVFISGARIVTRAVIAGAPRDLERGGAG